MVLLALAVRGDPAKGASTNAGRASANLTISMTIEVPSACFAAHPGVTHSQRARSDEQTSHAAFSGCFLNCKLCGLRVDCGTYVFSSAKP